MNAGWNAVNLGIAGLGLLALRKDARKSHDMSSSFKAQQRLERSLLFNTGLDEGYMMAGLFFNERGKNIDSEMGLQNQGFGLSLLLQGGFLLAFDLISFLTHNAHGKELKLELTQSSNGIGLSLTF